ncbi:guanine nucleotide-binding protein subunit gamma 2-like isoform X1 [Juglans regia]|uniref:Guanine nucleotide-binding protein subunit gamma 2-like isoform X1 n=1 Tax=Juglans regia TaxID=51240 RepID=A0A6P9E995_JUGRE|nr:guanine nucleotide-binding protein subunit gamma 2-like isoform X1 [Juglans regia]
MLMMQSGRSGSARPITHLDYSLSAFDTRGKHRIQAEIKRLEQEARFLEFISLDLLQLALGHGKLFCDSHFHRVRTFWKKSEEELEQLEKMESASSSCKEMLSNVEPRPDPLLPMTNGPINPFWDRWFEGPQDSKGCRCWIF